MARLGVDQRAIAEFLARLGRAYPVDAAYLFGSRAVGEELLDSDYDVIVVSSAFARVRSWDRIAACLDAWSLAEPLHAICLTPDEMTALSAQITVVREALRGAIRLH